MAIQKKSLIGSPAARKTQAASRKVRAGSLTPKELKVNKHEPVMAMKGASLKIKF
jgi:hypothetical protein